MKKWTMTDVLLLLLANLLAVFVTKAVLRCIGTLFLSYSFYPAVLTLFLLSLLFSAAVSFYFKKRGKRLRPYALTLAGLELLLLLLSQNLTFSARIARVFTGCYNLEGTGFSLFFAILYCLGLLAGCGLAHILDQRNYR